MRKPNNHTSNRNNYGRNRGSNNGGKYRSNNGSSSGDSDSQSMGRQKKHAMTQKDKFQAMGRNQLANGDRERAEYYFQHVEHYTRVLAEITEKEALMSPRQQQENVADVDSAEEAAVMSENHAEENAEARESQESHDEPRRTPSPRRERPQRRERPERAIVADDDAEEIPLPMDILPDVTSAAN